MTYQKVAIVTGSSRGIGFETSLTLAKNGFKTYATVRNLKTSQKLQEAKNEDLTFDILELDVTNDTSIQKAIETIEHKEGHIDLLVNNAAFTMLGAVEDLSYEEIYSQFNTNVFGVFRTIKEIVPIMRKQGQGGTIINIGSANGFFGVPCGSAYVATKFALEGITQSLRFELRPFGINVSLIEPGAINTEVAAHSMFIPKRLQQQKEGQGIQPDSHLPFEKMTKEILEKSKAVLKSGSSPKIVAELILKVATTENPKFRYQAGVDAEQLFESKTKMDDDSFEKFLAKIFDL